jgi:hypothetical protein
MGVVESAVDELVGLKDADAGARRRQPARKEQLIGCVVLSAIVLTQVAWFVGLLFAARLLVFS